MSGSSDAANEVLDLVEDAAERLAVDHERVPPADRFPALDAAHRCDVCKVSEVIDERHDAKLRRVPVVTPERR